MLLSLCLIIQAISFRLVAEKPHLQEDFSGVTRLAFKDLVSRSVGRQVQQLITEQSTNLRRSDVNLTLLTSFFYGTDHEHWPELAGALHVNLHNPFFNKVHVLMESPGGSECGELQAKISEALDGAEWSADAQKRLICVPVPNQPNYESFFDYANSHLAGQLVALANTDVAFDDTLGLIDREAFGPDLGYVISVQPPPYSGEYKDMYGTECETETRCSIGLYDGWTWGGNSWDVYMFRSPLQGMHSNYLNHYMNQLGGENRAAYQIEKGAGVHLSNPCKHIHAFHWHCSGGKMHDHSRVDGEPGENAVQGINPCWDCPGLTHLPAGKAPLQDLCAQGSRHALADTALHLDVRHPACTFVCLSSSDATPKGLCEASGDVDCVISECGTRNHEYY